MDDRVIIDCLSSEDIVRLRLSPVPVPVEAFESVVVVGDFDFRLGTINSSHRRSCKPVRNGSFPLDLSESEKDRPGDLRTPPASPFPAVIGGAMAMDVGGGSRLGGGRGGEG